MNETTQEERILKVIEKVKANSASMDDEKRASYEGLKAVDLFNATVSGAIAKLNTFGKLYNLTANMPKDAPEELIKYLAALLEDITREEMNGICDCLLAVVACEPDEAPETQGADEEKEAC